MVAASAIIHWLFYKRQYTPVYQISVFKTLGHRVNTQRSISSVNNFSDSGYTSTVEADSHADTFVAGKNCVPLHYTERTCDVQPYSDDYAPMTNVPIITAATGYTSASGLNYILVFPEALYMPKLSHSLFNPNQLRHFGTKVQDNPYDSKPMSLSAPDESFTACLQSKGTDIYLTTWAPSQSDLASYPHIALCSSQAWNPREVRFPGISNLEQEEIEVRNVQEVRAKENENDIRSIRATTNNEIGEESAEIPEHDLLYDINQFRRRIMSSARVTYDDYARKC